MKRCLIALLLLASMPALAKPGPTKTGKVLSQNIGSENGGTAVLPLGSGLVGVPITRNSNVIVLETSLFRVTLSEMGRKFVVLPVNGTVSYYQDGSTVVILDSDGKKHKFSIVHLESLTPAN